MHAGRTRLAQARAELGMTDRTGGPSSTNYIHRTRPENYEEEDEVDSDGEDGDVLLGWTNDGGTVKVKDEREKKEKERLERQDLSLARTLRLRAEGLEKVVTSMLGQPPPLQPAPPHTLPPSFHPSSSSSTAHSAPSAPSTQTATTNHPLLGPSSGHHQPDSDSHLHGHSHSHSTSSRTRTGRHPHILPNGVRLRLALGTLINDFFARQAPHPPYRHIQSRRASRASSPISKHPSQSDTTVHDDEEIRDGDEDGEGESKRAKKAAEMDLPKALLPLTLITGGIKSASNTSSSDEQEEEDEDDEDDPMQGNQSPYDLEYPQGYAPYGLENSSSFYQPTHQPVGLSPFAVPDFHQQQQYQSFSLSGQSEGQFGLSSPAQITHSLPRSTSRKRTKPKPSARTVELYEAGVDAAIPSSSHSSCRCPRHLYIGCQVCVEAKGGTSSSASGSSSGSGFRVGGSGSSGRPSGTGSINIGVSATQGVGMVGNSATYASSAASANNALAGMSLGTSGGVAGTAGTGGNITGWKDGTGIGTGLLKPDMRGSVLRRAVALPGSPPQGPQQTSPSGKSQVGHNRSPSTQSRVQPSSPQRKKAGAKEAEQSYEQETGAGNTKLSKLIPRFIKLSALVAGELGREIRGEEVDASAVLQTEGASTTSTSGAGFSSTSVQAGKAAAADAGDADESGSESEGDSGSEGSSRKSRRADSTTPTPVKREESTPRPSSSSSPFKMATATPSSVSTSSPAQPTTTYPSTHKHHGQHHHPNHIRHGKRAHEKMYAYALRPTREWYLLLAGLLTRAVLEGYLTAGWSGIACVECLMGVGVGVKKQRQRQRKESLDSSGNVQASEPTHTHGVDGNGECMEESEDEDDYADEDDALFEEVEPDEYPTLKEALRVLFPSLRCTVHGKDEEVDKGEKGGKGEAEREYEEEMYRRLRMVSLQSILSCPPYRCTSD